MRSELKSSTLNPPVYYPVNRLNDVNPLMIRGDN